MHIIEIPHTNRTIGLPEYLGEFTNDQFRRFCKVFVNFIKEGLDYGTFRIQALYELLDMHSSKKVFKEAAIEDRNENIFRLSTLIDGYFIEENREGQIVKNLDLSFIDNKIPNFVHKGVLYHGPKEALINTTFDEYIQANTSFKNFARTGDINSLDLLVATLYRPSKEPTPENLFKEYEGDIRQEFIQYNIERRANALNELPYHIKYGVYLFFWACQNYIATATEVEVEGQKVDFSVLFNSENSGDKNIGMVGLLFSLSETKVFGNKKETGKELLWTILLRLVQNHLEAENLKRKSKK